MVREKQTEEKKMENKYGKKTVFKKYTKNNRAKKSINKKFSKRAP
jgi:hypothetical protein